MGVEEMVVNNTEAVENAKEVPTIVDNKEVVLEEVAEDKEYEEWKSKQIKDGTKLGKQIEETSDREQKEKKLKIDWGVVFTFFN
jgi:hypothetical protein